MATYQSLYRRYRPQRFDEVLGQDHITKALRNAVRDGRVGHAYLFSGPRGTGKTSTARILAKVLNCAAPVDGEPCGQCESCVAVAEGRIVDWLLEQDAASKSKVDDMRDLLERVPLGTSGNRKVIILDEVHMLSQGAENALLKTLEEPPEHVVFVLATTDPQKVRPTIRSRTQQFEFHLLPPDVLADHVRRVISDAGLGLDDLAVDHVVRTGGGSARDTLSALDQVSALGEVMDDAQPVDAIVDALCDRDAGAVLVAVADALASGRDPRTLGEALIAALRNAFLAVMGVGDVHLGPADRERAAAVGQRLGAAGITRALEVLGEALTELARKPDPRIVVEVALVRLTRADTDRTLDAVLERLDRLERGLPAGASGGPPAGPAPAPPPSSASAPAPAPPPSSASAPAPAPPPSSAPAPASGPSSSSPPPGPSSSPSSGPSVESARAALADARGSARAGAPGRAEVPSEPAAPSSAPSAGAGGSGQGEAPSAAKGSGPSGGAGGSGRADAESGSGGAAGSRGSSPGSPEPAPASRPTLGAVARGQGAPSAIAADGPPATASAESTSASPSDGDAAPTPGELVPAWEGQILSQLAIPVRSKWRGGRWTDPAGGTVRFAVPNEWHQKVCEDTRRDVEDALAAHFGRRVPVAVVVDGDAHSAPTLGEPGRAPGPPGPIDPGVPDDHDEHIDPSELRDAGDVTTGGVDLLMREFGGKLVEEDL
jgi:DNA polymerase III subunit gamma/tau